MYCNYIGIVSVFSVLSDTGESITFELQMTPMEPDFTHETLVRSEVECALTCQRHRDCTRYSYPAEDYTCYFDAVEVDSYITDIVYVTEVVYVDVWNKLYKSRLHAVVFHGMKSMCVFQYESPNRPCGEWI